MNKILQGTGLTAEDLDNDPEMIRTPKYSTFDYADLVKA